MRQLSAISVTFLMISVALMAVVGPAHHAGAATITTFSGGSSTVTVDFPMAGNNDVNKVVLPSNVLVTSATVNVTGLSQGGAGVTYPKDVSLDFGIDDVIEWGWNGTNNGAMGMQNRFSDGSSAISLNYGAAGSDESKAVRLPKGANVTNATFEVSGGNLAYFNEKLYFGHARDFVGFQVSPVGDVNGDGIPDFAASGPHSGWGQYSFGRVIIVFGGKTLSANPDVEILATVDDERFGWSLAGAGDVNNDGYDDIIVGGNWWGTASEWEMGAAYIYYGGPSMDTVADVTIRATMEYDFLGSAVAGIGDVNGDGFDDVLVGAPGNDSGGSSAGAAYIYYGGSPMNNVPDYSFFGPTDYYYLGTCVANVSDVNNDGHGDFAISATGDGDGAVYIYYGGATLDTTVDVTLKPVSGYDFGQWFNGVGDLNGDGFDDVGIMNDYQEVWVYKGGNPMDTVRYKLFLGEGTWDNYGYAIDGVEDLNGDGYDELLVGAFTYNNSITEVGKAYLYYGGSDMDDTADRTWQGKNEGDEFGLGLAGVGDINQDGISDIVLGDDGNDTFATNAGTVHVLMWAQGILDPKVGLSSSGALLWNKTGYFTGSAMVQDFSQKLNAALPGAQVSVTDPYNNTYSDLKLNISIASKGDIKITNMTIKYDLTVTTDDFAAKLNAYMATHDPDLDGYYRILIRVSSSTAGSVVLSGLRISYDEIPEGTAPTGITMNEGTVNMSLVDLYTVFTDDIDADEDLTYAVLDTPYPQYLNASISLGHILAVDLVAGSADVNWTGSTYVNVTATDKSGGTSKPVTVPIVVKNVNDPPVITSKPNLTATEGVKYIYEIVAMDPDIGDTLTYSASSDALDLSMPPEPSSHFIKYNPSPLDAPEVHVVVNVTDGTFTATQAFTIKVELRTMAGNHLPIITSIPPVYATVGYTYQYQMKAFDEDNDKLYFTKEVGPSGMELNLTTGIMTWTPATDDANRSFNVVVNVSDGFDRSFQRWSIHVNATGMNHLPALIGTPPARAYIGVKYYYKFTATDEDGDLVTFRLAGGPSGMIVNSDGALTWYPSGTQSGTHQFSVEATDTKGIVRRAFSVDVVLNHVPEVKSFPVLDAKVGKTYKYTLTIEDLDPADTVNVSLANAPPGMTYDPATKTITWKPNKKQTGSYDIVIVASDGIQNGYQNYTVKVKGAPTQSIFEQMGLLLLIIIIVVVVTIVGVFAYMRMKKKAAEARTVIEDVFLTYRDGRLIFHTTRRLKPDQDGATMTAMLTAIQDFVKESVPTEGTAQKPIDEITFGQDKIIMTHGQWVYISAVTQGKETEGLRNRMKDAVMKIESQFGTTLAEWDGDLRDLEGAKAIVKELTE